MRQKKHECDDSLVPIGGPCPGALPAKCQPRVPNVGAMLIDEGCVRIEDGAVTHMVALNQYQGVVISTVSAPSAEVAIVEVRHADPTKSAILYGISDDAEISDLLYAWQMWGERLDLPRFVEMPDGSLCAPPPDLSRSDTFDLPAEPRRHNRHYRTRRPQSVGVRVFRPHPGCNLGLERII